MIALDGMGVIEECKWWSKIESGMSEKGLSCLYENGRRFLNLYMIRALFLWSHLCNIRCGFCSSRHLMLCTIVYL